MCYYKPNKPPCTCTYLQLIQPCSSAQMYPSPSPTRNPNPVIRVCSKRDIAKGVGMRSCEKCSARQRSTSTSTSIDGWIRTGTASVMKRSLQGQGYRHGHGRTDSLSRRVSRFGNVGRFARAHMTRRRTPPTSVPANGGEIVVKESFEGMLGDEGMGMGMGIATEKDQDQDQVRVEGGERMVSHLLSPTSISAEEENGLSGVSGSGVEGQGEGEKEREGVVDGGRQREGEGQRERCE